MTDNLNVGRSAAAALAAPFPYFGGKRRAAHIVWDALGDVSNYVEPFCGSAAVLLARPPFTGRRVETLNDADGWLVNTWRAIQLSPDAVAEHVGGPVTEVDYHARLAWLQDRRTPDLVAWLEGDPENHDAKAAGWWLYVMACGIGDPWNSGPWKVVDGHLRDTRGLPHLGTPGRGVNRGLPHLGNPGQGVNRGLPHLGNPGQGVNRGLPHLGDPRQDVQNYMRALSTRLERTRITCGDWQRVVKPSVLHSAGTNSRIGVFLDPPYTTSGNVYAETNTGKAHTDIPKQVRDWCQANGDTYRIVLCGFKDDHDVLLAHGWRKELGRAGRGYNTDGRAGRRERLWLSPSCVTPQHVLDFEEGML